MGNSSLLIKQMNCNNSKRLFVIGYDISNPKRLNKVYKAMCKYATPLQYSIFVLNGTTKQCEKCLETMTAIINPEEDDFRCYVFPQYGLKSRIGSPSLPTGIVWTDLPNRWE